MDGDLPCTETVLLYGIIADLTDFFKSFCMNGACSKEFGEFLLFLKILLTKRRECAMIGKRFSTAGVIQW